MTEKTFKVSGMSCAACSARIEKELGRLNGISSVEAVFAGNTVFVSFDPDKVSEEKITSVLDRIGYPVVTHGTRISDWDPRKIAASGILSAVLFVYAMGPMFGLDVPGSDDPRIYSTVQLVLCLPVLLMCGRFFVKGARSLMSGTPTMDTLVSLGSGAAFAYSLYITIRSYVTGAGVMGICFDSAAMILTLITVGKMLEARARGRTTDALKSLMRLSPKTARVERDGTEMEVAVEAVRRGDIFLVKPGESVPVDGIVLDGISAVNESALTGESIPADKEPGDAVSAATINQSGFLRCEATRVGEDTTLSQIIKMVSDAAATKAPVAKAADRVSGVFVPAVIAIALVTVAAWLLSGETFGFALARGISVLVISCPCALGLATPVAIMVGSGVGAKKGILFKTAVSLEETGKIQIAALDKTGTITKGEPQVTDLIAAEGFSQEELLSIAVSLEKKSEHPLAKAVLAKAAEYGIEAGEVTDFQVYAGSGLSGRLDGKELHGGSMKYIGKILGQMQTGSDEEGLIRQAEMLAEQGKTPLIFAEDGKAAGIIAVADVIKEDSAEAVKELQKMGIRVVMLTGDNEKTAAAMGKQAGVDEVIAGVLPDGKEQAVRSLSEHGRVLMVGDGINDAPALTRADIGMAIGAGADVAVDSADVVLMKSSLKDAAASIRLSRATLRNIHQNLFWAFFYNMIGIPLAAGVWIHAFGWQLNPMFAAAAMSLSSFCVVTNALRLNLFDPYDGRKDKKVKRKMSTEAKKTTKTLKIEGMMCGHCEAHVKKALEALEGVEAAEVSHDKGTAVVYFTSNAAASDEALKKAVEEEGYTVIAID